MAASACWSSVCASCGIEREQADADACVDVELHAADREWLLQCAAHALRRLLGGCRGLGEPSRKVSHQQEELVAAVSADDVVRSRGAAQAFGDGGEHLVARLVAEAVVDELEVIEVDVEDGDGAPAPGCARERVVELASELVAVRQAREGIVIGAMDQVVLGDA